MNKYEKLKQKRVQSWLDTVPEELRFDSDNPQSKDYEGLSLINLLPKNKSVLITPVKEEVVTDAGLFIPTIEQESLVNDRTEVSSYFGMIIASSPDTTWYQDENGKNVPYRAGDLCIYAKHRETHVRYGMKKLVMCSEFDIWGIIPENGYYEYVFDAKDDVFKNIRHQIKSQEEIEEREKPKGY